jgi:hypothetical protein
LPNLHGYLVKTLDRKTLIIRGRTVSGTVFAAAGLLKRYAGVRRFWPGEPGGIGDVIPKTKSLKLPDVEWRDWPYWLSRNLTHLDQRGPQKDSDSKITLNDFWRAHQTIKANHSYGKLLNIAEHLNEPELFPLINGNRFIPATEEIKEGRKRLPQSWQPCVSNPRVAEIMAESLLKIFRTRPEVISLPLEGNDGYGDCRCEACRAMDAPGADVTRRTGLSDRYVKFNNRVAELVAKEYPNRMLAMESYGSVNDPPQTVYLHPMLFVNNAIGQTENTYRVWDSWKPHTPLMGVRLYRLESRFIIPKMDIHQSARRLRYLVGSGAHALHCYLHWSPIFPLTGNIGYLYSELLWDPRLDEEQILNDYYDNFYGKAAPAMKAFYNHLEKAYQQWLVATDTQPHPYGPEVASQRDNRSFEQFSVLPWDTALLAQGCLRQALSDAADPVVEQRVQITKLVFDFAVIGSREYWALQRLKNTEAVDVQVARRMLADAREVVQSGLELAQYKEEVMEKAPAKVYAAHTGDGVDHFYAAIRPGTIHTQVMIDLAKGFSRISNALAQRMGRKEAQAWCNAQEEAEKNVQLRQLMKIAGLQAAEAEVRNIIEDPGFEKRGAANDRDGLYLANQESNPLRYGFDQAIVHGGKQAVVLSECQQASLFELFPAKEGECFQLALWVRHNNEEAKYTIRVRVQTAQGKTETDVEIPWKPDQWQKIAFPFVAPPETRKLGIGVHVEQQAMGAKLWIDDLLAGRYTNN